MANPQSDRFVISPHVCSATDKDGTTVLSFEANTIYSIIGVGSIMWSTLAASSNGLPFESIVAELTHRFKKVPPSQIGDDVERLLADFGHRGIVRTSEEGPIRFLGRLRCFVPTVFAFLACSAGRLLIYLQLDALAAFLGIATATLMLKLVGFATLFRTVTHWPVTQGRSDINTTEKACASVDTATTWFPKRALCLQRSAVAACLMRLYGLDAQMVIGCRKIPFKAHAWVEVNGQVANDNPKVKHFYKVLGRC